MFYTLLEVEVPDVGLHALQHHAGGGLAGRLGHVLDLLDLVVEDLDCV